MSQATQETENQATNLSDALKKRGEIALAQEFKTTGDQKLRFQFTEGAEGDGDVMCIFSSP